MVLRHSDVLIAVWDPEERPSQIWGTTRLVNEARHDDLLVVHIDPKKPSEYHLDVREEDADIHQMPADALDERIRGLVAPLPGGSLPYQHFLNERPPRWTAWCPAWQPSSCGFSGPKSGFSRNQSSPSRPREPRLCA